MPPSHRHGSAGGDPDISAPASQPTVARKSLWRWPPTCWAILLAIPSSSPPRLQHFLSLLCCPRESPRRFPHPLCPSHPLSFSFPSRDGLTSSSTRCPRLLGSNHRVPLLGSLLWSCHRLLLGALRRINRQVRLPGAIYPFCCPLAQASLLSVLLRPAVAARSSPHPAARYPRASTLVVPRANTRTRAGLQPKERK